MDPQARGRNLAAAHGSLEMGGKRYLVSQPTDQDMQTIGLFLHKQLKARGQQVPQSDADAADAITEELCTVAGVRFLAWILLRKEQPRITQAEIDAAVHEHSYLHYFSELTRESGMGDLGNSGGATG